MKEDILIIYHNNCFDGFTAAWIANKYFKNKPIFFGASYGLEPPNVKDKDVYILDFSYPRDVLIEMKEEANSLLVLDHHKSAEKDLRGLDYCIFDMERSGAGITWDFFYNHQPRPWLVNIVEDRDLWRFKYPDTKAITAFMATLPMTFPNWDLLNETGQEEVRN